MGIANEEIKLDKYKYIMSRTDTKGMIEFANDYFVEISGYTTNELIGKPHNLIRHPDMPKVIFKLMWDRLNSKKDIMAIVKNRAKDGRYYWVTTHFDIKYHYDNKTVDGYLAYRQAARPNAVKAIEPLYATLLEIEREQGISESEKYLNGFLESKGMSYDEYINEVVENRGAFALFFKAMRKFFS